MKELTDKSSKFEATVNGWTAYCLFKAGRYDELLQLQLASPLIVYYQIIALFLQGNNEAVWQRLSMKPTDLAQYNSLTLLESHLLNKKVFEQFSMDHHDRTQQFLLDVSRIEQELRRQDHNDIGLWFTFSYQQLEDRIKAQSIIADLAQMYPFDPNLAHAWAIFSAAWCSDLMERGDYDQALEQLKLVIANFAYLLVCESFWQEWIEVRQKKYQTTINREDITRLKSQIEKYVSEIIPQRLACMPEEEQSHLVQQWEVAWEQELAATRLLKRSGQFKVMITNQELQVGFGPLFMISRNLEERVKDFFKIASQIPTQHVQESLSELLVSSPEQSNFDKIFETFDPEIIAKLKRLFSELGTCEVLINKGRYQEALQKLENNQFDSIYRLKLFGIREFDTLRNKMISQAQLQSAENIIREHGANFIEARNYWKKALVSCQRWQGLDITKHQIIQTILGRVQVLQKRQIDQAVELLEYAHEFLPEGQISGKLAELLRVRSVPKANQAIKDKDYENLESCIPDFRRSLVLNPNVKQTRFDLCQVLFVCAESYHQQGGNHRAIEFFQEIMQIARNGLGIHQGDEQLNQFLREAQFRLRVVQRPAYAREEVPPNLFMEMLFQMSEEVANEQGMTVVEYNSSGVKREKQGDYEGAIRDFEKALEIDPYFKQAQINLKQTVRNYMNYLLVAGEVGRSFEVLVSFRQRYPNL